MVGAEEGNGQEVRIPTELPILPSGENVLFPSMIVPLATRDEKLVRLIDEAAGGAKMLGLFAEKGPAEGWSAENLYQVGTAANLARMLKLPDGSVQALLQGVARIHLLEITQTEPYIKGRVERIEPKIEMDDTLEAAARNVADLFQKVVSLAPNLPDVLAAEAMHIPDPGNLADFAAANIHLNTSERQEILETVDVLERLKKLTSFLNHELEILEIGSKIQSQIKGEMDKAQREFYLRQQLKAIQQELGETDEATLEINELREKIAKAQMPPEAQKEAERELDRLSKMSPAAAEYTVAKTYIDWLVSLPWAVGTQDNLDVGRAQQVLDEDHYDLDKVKERILEYLAVRKLKADTKGPILCFAGPPGVGKTSLGQSIARALGRKFIRMSLGGMRDEAEIRGHRRTYVGALPGRIIQGIRRAESNNPVFMLDEIDKVGLDFRGDPTAALLEVLDPEQNFSFTDHYLDVAFDLSKVMFITTANILDTVPPALRDRMEVLWLPGYTEPEKLEIAKRYLLPRQLRENGLGEGRLEIAEEALRRIIRSYTREAGLRNLEREIATICRKVAKQVAEGATGLIRVDVAELHQYLGPERFRYEMAEEEDEVGVATGLAWTEAGGDVLFVEAALVPGRGNLMLTGKLGEVMQESAKAAFTFARSRATALGIPEDFYQKYDVHIHVPAGAIPKDGPSAGITITLALLSALTRRPVSKEIAMTGEITLHGKLLPVGGIKEKVLAAHRAGIKKVILPKDNERDLEEVPAHVREELQFTLAQQIDEAVKLALKPEVKEEKLELAASVA